MTTTKEVRQELRKAWRERDLERIWFYGSWLVFGKWPTFPILGVLLGGVAGFFISRAL